MFHRSRELGLAALLVACSGCGGGGNTPSTSNNIAENPSKANEQMLKMYGPPKADTSKPINAADKMKNMYGR